MSYSIAFAPATGNGTYTVSYNSANLDLNGGFTFADAYFEEYVPSFTLTATPASAGDSITWKMNGTSVGTTSSIDYSWYKVDNITFTVEFGNGNSGDNEGIISGNGGELTSAANTTFIQDAMFTLNPAGLALDGSSYYTLPKSTQGPTNPALGSTWTVALNYTPGTAPGEGNTSQIITQQLTPLGDGTHTDCQCTIGYFGNGISGAGFDDPGYYAGVRITGGSYFFVFPLLNNDGTVLTPDTSYSIALSLDASKTLRCYVNGTQITTLKSTGSGFVPVNEIILDYAPSSSNPLLLGTSWSEGTPSQFITGTLNALHIFPRALPAAAISYLHTGSLSSPTILDASDNGLVFELDATKNLVDLVDISSSSPGYTPVSGNNLVLDGNSFFTIANGMDTTDLSGSWTVAMRYMELSPPAAGTYSQIIGQKFVDENDGGRVFTIGKFDGQTSYTEPEYIVSMIKLPEGTWEHSAKFTLNSSGWTDIVATFNGSTVTVYVDGALVGSPISVNRKISSPQPLYIGKNGWTDAPLINGAIAQLLIYDRPMSASEAYFLHSGLTLPLLELTGDASANAIYSSANEIMKNPDSAIAAQVAAATAIINQDPTQILAVNSSLVTSLLLAVSKTDLVDSITILTASMNQGFAGSVFQILDADRDTFYAANDISGTQPLYTLFPDLSDNLFIDYIPAGSSLCLPIKKAGTYTFDTNKTITIDESYNQFFNGSSTPLALGDTVSLSGKMFTVKFLDLLLGEKKLHINAPSTGTLSVVFNSASTQVTSPGYDSTTQGTYTLTASPPAGTMFTHWTTVYDGKSGTISHNPWNMYYDGASYVDISANYQSLRKLTVIAPDSTDGTVSVDNSALSADTEYFNVDNYSLVATPTPASGKVFRYWSIVVGSTREDRTNTNTTLSYNFTSSGSNVTITPVFGTPGSLTIVCPTSGGTVSVDGTPLTQDRVITDASSYVLTASASGFAGWYVIINSNTTSYGLIDNPYIVDFDGFSTTVVNATFSGGGGGGGAICFLKNAPVLTPSGYRRIADLRVGDLVQTPEGNAVSIQAVKIQQHVRPSQAVNPYVIPKGQYGATKELLISPEHKVLANGAMVEAKFLGLKQAAMADSFDYYNLELPNYEQMVVAGVVVESLYPLVRVKVSMAQFKQALIAKYGAITPELLASIKNKIRVHADGNVELLTLKRLTK